MKELSISSCLTVNAFRIFLSIPPSQIHPPHFHHPTPPPACSTQFILYSLLKRSLATLSLRITTLLLPLPPTDRAHICFYTREGDVESLQRYGEVRNEAQLGLEVPIEAGINRSGPL